MVAIASDEVVFGDDAGGVAELGEDGEAGAGDFEAALDGLLAVGDAAHHDGLRLPRFLAELGAEQLGGV